MNKYVFLFFLIGFAIVKALQPDSNSEDIERISIDDFIDQLAKNKYRQSRGLPEFKLEHINKLLDLAKSDTSINNFPRNPLSSYFQMEGSLRAVSLWIIEGIRKNYGKDSVNFTEWYPSLNPILVKKADTYPDYQNNPEVINQAYLAYIQWWNEIGSKDTLNVINKDPLENTGLRWH